MASKALPALVLLALVCGELVTGGHAQALIGGAAGVRRPLPYARGSGSAQAGMQPLPYPQGIGISTSWNAATTLHYPALHVWGCWKGFQAWKKRRRS